MLAVKRLRACSFVFEQACYGAPFRLVGQRLCGRGGARRCGSIPVTMAGGDTPARPRARAGATRPDHLSPEKIPGVFWARKTRRTLAAEGEPATVQLVEIDLADPVLDRLPRVIRVLKLCERVGRPGGQPPALGRGTSGT